MSDVYWRVLGPDTVSYYSRYLSVRWSDSDRESAVRLAKIRSEIHGKLVMLVEQKATSIANRSRIAAIYDCGVEADPYTQPPHIIRSLEAALAKAVNCEKTRELAMSGRCPDE